jgi:hypothetical protein
LVNLHHEQEVKHDIRLDPVNGTLLGQYSLHGLIDRGVYDWEVFEPFYVEKELPPPWGNRYLFEICSWIIDRPRMMGDHSFMRLKTPRGEWYSVGQYRPAKASIICIIMMHIVNILIDGIS